MDSNQRSTDMYQTGDRSLITVSILAGLLAIHTGLIGYGAYVHSPTLNEPGHLVAGLSHLEFNRFDVYRVNPPLVRTVAAIPVWLVGYDEDWSRFSDSPQARSEFTMGEDFVRANGQRSYFLFMIARWACVPFSWLGAIICYLWARDLYGRSAGVVACALWCFSPNILAHASLITADAHATALGLAACYTFWRWLVKPSWTQAALTGCVLGLAELAKTTLILFYPLWPLMWILFRWPDRKQMGPLDWIREAGMLLLRMAIGLLVLNLGYDFEGSFKPLKDYHFVSDMFTGAVEVNAKVDDSKFAVAPPTNRFADTWLGSIPAPFPENYLRGIDVQQSDFESFHSPSYLRGEFRDQGWWYYYLYALAIKVPIGTWALGLIVIVLRFSGRLLSPGWRNEMILLGPALIIFGVVSSKTGFSHHMRYVLPCFPFVFVWLGQIAQAFPVTRAASWRPFSLSRAGSPRYVRAWALVFLGWSIASSLWVYPHSLSYFNESVGGPFHGADHLINSNIDWGQDLRYLQWWRETHSSELKGQPFFLAYDGFVNPADLGLADALPWPVADGDSVVKLTPGYYAISVNLLKGAPTGARDGQVADGQSQQVRLAPDLVEYFQSLKPIGRAGYSILIFEIE